MSTSKTQVSKSQSSQPQSSQTQSQSAKKRSVQNPLAPAQDANTEQLQQELTDLLAKLVSIESTDPGAYEQDIAHYIYSWLHERIALAGNFASAIVLDMLEVMPSRPCVRIRIPSATELNAQGSTAAAANNTPADLTFLCHMDTVREGAGWNPETPAFTPTIRDGALYGRGSCDMKAGLTVALIAIAQTLEHIGCTHQLPKKSLALICTCDEEDVMRGSEACIAAGWLGARGWVMDLEPTSGSARGSHKGRTWFEVCVEGITAHASTPWAGADAIAGAATLITELRAAVMALPTHAELGTSTITFGQIKGGYSPYVVPDSCTFTVDLRLVPPSSTALAQTLIARAASTAEKNVPGIHVHTTCTGDRPPIEFPQNSELFSALAAAHQTALGAPLERDVFTGYTDTAVVAGQCGNPECLSFGPGNLELAHKPNEHVDLSDLVRVSHVVHALIVREILG